MKFREKPVEIEAMQFDGNEDGMWDIADKLDIYQDAISFLDLKDKMVCHTLKGNMVADKGDWIIKGANGEIYPCKPDIFEMTYEPAICEKPMPEIISSSNIQFEHDETYLVSNLCPGCMKPKQFCTHETTACIG